MEQLAPIISLLALLAATVLLQLPSGGADDPEQANEPSALELPDPQEIAMRVRSMHAVYRMRNGA